MWMKFLIGPPLLGITRPIARPYTELTKEFMWLNLTLLNQSALFTVIRELEFALIQLTRQVDELQMAVQHSLSGKLSMSILGPNVLTAS